MIHLHDPSGVEALSLLPSGVYVLTATHDGRRAGFLVRWAQACSVEPALICVAVRTGNSVEPLIRDSRAFALCRIDPEDRFLRRKFSIQEPPDEMGDPFDSIPVETLATGSPVIKRSQVAFDCEVVRHFDMDADHELYVGRILAACVYGE